MCKFTTEAFETCMILVAGSFLNSILVHLLDSRIKSIQNLQMLVLPNPRNETFEPRHMPNQEIFVCFNLSTSESK